jgi:hypothetical protein
MSKHSISSFHIVPDIEGHFPTFDIDGWQGSSLPDGRASDSDPGRDRDGGSKRAGGPGRWPLRIISS